MTIIFIVSNCLDHLIEQMLNNSIAENNNSNVGPEPNDDENGNDVENASGGQSNLLVGGSLNVEHGDQPNDGSQNDVHASGGELEDSLIYVNTYMADVADVANGK